MVSKIVLKLTIVKKRDKQGRPIYRSPRIYLPTKLTDDSCFPFREGQPLLAKVVGEKLVIEKAMKTKRKA
jgi:hypothetical protein